MIGYLQGTLKHLDAARALVVANGVGYEVHISAQTYYRLEGQREAALDIYTHVREDALSLYGFATPEEKFAFEKLISISGIGPTLAQKILSGIDAPDLAAGLRVAGAGGTLPQKSTYFYPKPPSGMLFHLLDPNRPL